MELFKKGQEEAKSSAAIRLMVTSTMVLHKEGDNLAMMYTSDVYGADFLFHTHPRDHFSPPRYPVI